MFTCLIIDDEQHCIDGLKAMLEQRFGERVKVLATCNDPLQAPQLVHQHKPDVLFLDVEMPRLTGIDLVKMMPDKKFEVVFTTAWEKYALEAIKVAAADYLVKPFSIDSLDEAIARCEEKIDVNRQLARIIPAKPAETPRFAITAQNGTLLIVDPAEIIWIRADSNYSTIFFTSRPKLLVAKTLKEFDDQLSPYNFFRIHSGGLINIAQAKSYHCSSGEEYVLMSNGDKVDLSRRRKAELFELIRKI